MDSEDKFAGKFRGFLFPNRFAKTDRHPVKTGRFSFTKEQIRRLFERAKASKEDEILCDASAWERTSKSTGDPYLFISVDCEREPGQKQGASAGGDDIPF